MEKLLHQVHRFHINELTEMYITVAIRSFAVSMIGIFVPLLMLDFGYAIQEVLLYQLTLPVFGFLVILLASSLVQRIGVKHTMLSSIFFLVIFYFFMYTLETYHWNFLFISLVVALAVGLFWFCFHLEFAKYSSGKKRGSQVGLLYGMTAGISIIGPILGGFIITSLGSHVLLIINALLLIISGIPLLLTKDEKIPLHITWNDVCFRTSLRQRISFVAEGARGFTATIFWPIFLAIMQMGFLVVGTVYTVVRIVDTITSFIVGKYLDHSSAKGMLRVGTFLNGISLLVRAFLPINAVIVTSITSLGGIGFTLLNNSYAKIWYDKAHEYGAAFLVSREFYLELGRFALMFVALVLFSIFQLLGYDLFSSTFAMCVVIFIVGAIASITMNVID